MMTALMNTSTRQLIYPSALIVFLWGSVALADAEASRETSDKPWSVALSVSNGVGSGTFVSNSFIRQTSDWVGQSWNLSADYRFAAWSRTLVLRSSWSFDYELTTPNGGTARRFSPSDLRLSLSESETYRDELTGIALSTGLRLTLPVSYESRGATDLYFAVGLNGAATRALGPVTLSWSLGMTKYIQGSTIKLSRGIERCGQGSGRGPVDAVSFSPDACQAVLGLNPEGFPNTSFLLSNRLGASWEIIPAVTASYSVGLNQYFKYGMQGRDALTSVHAAEGMRRVDYFWPTLDATVELSELVESLQPLPVALSLSTGITATHPTRSADDKSIIWPFFASSFGQGRAANGYGSIYVDLTGTW